jgi:chaperonin cofactor prefoldin
MKKLQERANELLQEREKAIARVNEINGALQELERLAKETNESTETEETDG